MSVQEINLKAIADAIREKEGSSAPIPAKDFAQRIRAIQAGGGFSVPLVVSADPGTVITAVNGEETVTGTVGENGNAILSLTSPGSWSVNARLGDKVKGPIVISVKGDYMASFVMSSRLPAGYTEVEYITNPVSEGKQAYLSQIGLPMQWMNDTRIELRVRVPDAPEKLSIIAGNNSYYYNKNTSNTFTETRARYISYSEDRKVALNSGTVDVFADTGELMEIVVDLPKTLFRVNETDTVYCTVKSTHPVSA